MKLTQILEKMEKDDALTVLRHVYRSDNKSIPELVRRVPELREKSQRRVKELYGSRFTVYRSLKVTDALRKENIVHTSADLGVVVGLADNNANVFFAKDRTIVATDYLLSYEISPENVVAYIPLLAAEARAVVGKRRKYIDHGWDSRIEVSNIYDAANNEEELIVDVSGLKPNVVKFDNRDDLYLFKEVMSGKFRDGRSYLKDIQANTSGIRLPRGFKLGGSKEDYERALNAEVAAIEQKAIEYRNFLK